MKIFLMILGAIFILILLAIGGLLAYSVINGTTLDHESKAWIDSVVPQIISPWDSEKLMGYGSSEFLKTVSKKDIDSTFTQLKKGLGPFVKYNGSIGEAGISINNFRQHITARYTVTANFQNGPVEVFVQGIKEDGQWKIYNIHVTLKRK